MLPMCWLFVLSSVCVCVCVFRVQGSRLSDSLPLSQATQIKVPVEQCIDHVVYVKSPLNNYTYPTFFISGNGYVCN